MSITDRARAEQADRTARNVLELVQVRRQSRHDRATILALREALAYGQAELDPELREQAASAAQDPGAPAAYWASTVLDLLDLIGSLPAILDRDPEPWTKNQGDTDHSPDQSVSGQRARVGWLHDCGYRLDAPASRGCSEPQQHRPADPRDPDPVLL